MDPQLGQVISDGGEEGGLLTAKSGILKSGWIVVTVKTLSDPVKSKKNTYLAEAEEYFCRQFKQSSVFFRDKISY